MNSCGHHLPGCALWFVPSTPRWSTNGRTREPATDASEAAANLAAPGAKQAVVEDRRGLTVLVRNAMFRRVQLMDLDKPDELGALDKDWG